MLLLRVSFMCWCHVVVLRVVPVHVLVSRTGIVSVLASCVGFMCWLHELGVCAGSMICFVVAMTFPGFVCWFSVLVVCVGFMCLFHVLAVCVGCLCLFHVPVACVCVLCWVHVLVCICYFFAGFTGWPYALVLCAFLCWRRVLASRVGSMCWLYVLALCVFLYVLVVLCGCHVLVLCVGCPCWFHVAISSVVFLWWCFTVGVLCWLGALWAVHMF